VDFLQKVEREDGMEGTPFVTVDYDEFKPETYRGFVIDWEGRKTRIFTGDFGRDYAYVLTEYTPFQHSSTIDHYLKDSGVRP
jgi:hypothetical protein